LYYFFFFLSEFGKLKLMVLMYIDYENMRFDCDYLILLTCALP